MVYKVPCTPMIGPEKEKILKELNLYFESPLIERQKMNSPVELPPDIPGRQEYVDKLNKMGIDELKKEMKKYGLKCGSKLMMKERLTMVWDYYRL